MLEIIITVIIIILVIYTYNVNNKETMDGQKINENKNNTENNENNKNNECVNIKNNICKKKYVGKCKKEIKINPYFVDLKYHSDYTDVLTGINDIAPEQKRVFNLMCMPVVILKVNDTEVKKIIYDFLDEFNNILGCIPEQRIANTGWDDKINDPKIKSGWDKYRSNLGLPVSLYEETKNTKINKNYGKVNLISYDDVKKVSTTNEIRYTMKLILQKKYVDDQIVLFLSLVSTKGEQKIIIEEFSVIGFLTSQSLYNGINYTSFGNLDDGNFMRDSDIVDELIKKDRERIKQSIIRNTVTDNFD